MKINIINWWRIHIYLIINRITKVFTILIPIKKLSPLLMPLKWVLKTGHRSMTTLLTILQFSIFISSNRYDNSSTWLRMFIISSWWVNFVIYLCMFYITSSWMSLFWVRTFLSSFTRSCYIMQPPLLTMIIQQHTFTNNYELLDYNTNWDRALILTKVDENNIKKNQQE
jgi:hypothetical protein